MGIIRKWMDADPRVRMKYSDWFFSLSNVQENNEGMVRCFKRFWVKDEKVAQEREMQRWINAAANRRAMWENLIPDLKEAYSLTESIEKDKVFSARPYSVEHTSAATFSARETPQPWKKPRKR